VTFQNNDYFEGEFKDDKPFKGIYKCFKNDDYYEGEFDGEILFKGTIKYTYSDGSVYEGTWKDGKPLNGKITYKNNDYFEGEFKDGKPFKGNSYSLRIDKLLDKDNLLVLCEAADNVHNSNNSLN
jgi:hypothetical protein